MEVREDGKCFVCGPENRAGLKTTFSVHPEEQGSSAGLQIPADFQGWEGVVHGGIIATLLDEAAIYACRSVGDQFVTAELKVKYKKPVPVGTQVEVRGRVRERKRKVLLVDSWVEIEGERFAEAESKIFAMDAP